MHNLKSYAASVGLPYRTFLRQLEVAKAADTELAKVLGNKKGYVLTPKIVELLNTHFK